MLKRFAAVLIGALGATVVIFALENVSSALYPMPPGFDPHDAAAMKSYIASLPVGALLIVLAAYALGSFAGGVVATRIAGRGTVRPAVIVGAVLTLLGIVNLVNIPQPIWFAVVSTLSYVPFAWLGSRVVRERAAG